MSNYVYGYVVTNGDPGETSACLVSLSRDQSLGLHKRDPKNLFSFPGALLPPPDAVCFSVTDGHSKNTAQYLVDGVDYVEEISPTLPRRARQRQVILTSLLLELLRPECVTTLVVAMSDSHEVERVVEANISDFEVEVLKDFSISAPPNTIYVVNKPR